MTLTPEASADSEEKKDSFVPLNQVAQNADGKEAADKADPEVEEYFDEEDESGTEPPINKN